MLRYPVSVASQQQVLAPLQALVSREPACEQWITIAETTEGLWDSLSAGALQLLSQIAANLGKVFDHFHTTNTQSIYSSQYLLTLALGAYRIAQNAALTAPLATGTVTLTLTQAAQTALATLSAWDAAQGYAAPTHPGAVAAALTGGVVIGP